MSVLFLLYKHDTIQHQNNLIHFLSPSYFLYIFKNVKKEINMDLDSNEAFAAKWLKI